MARKMVDDQDNAARSTAGLAPEPGYLPVCELNGDAKQRGRQIGRQTTHLIEHSIANYKSMFATCDISWQQACDKALPFLDYAQKICPDAVLEIEGMAEGSSFDMGSIAALNAPCIFASAQERYYRQQLLACTNMGLAWLTT